MEGQAKKDCKFQKSKIANCGFLCHMLPYLIVQFYCSIVSGLRKEELEPVEEVDQLPK